MKTVLLLGAGASRAEGELVGLSEENLPPLDYTFFEQARHHGLVGIDIVRSYLETEYKIDPFQPTSRYSMESVFNILYSDAIEEDDPGGQATRALDAIRVVYKNLIRQTTQDLGRADSDPIGDLLRWLYRDVSKEIDMITFNHDLILEHALLRITDGAADRRAPAFNISTDYGIDFYLPFPSRGQQFPNGIIHHDEAELRVHKLHGSLNWFTGSTEEDTHDWAIPKEGEKLFLCTGLEVRTDFQFKIDGDRYYLKPLIVPPIYEKSHYYAKILRPLWDRAADALRDAEWLVVFGYSMPEADIRARTLLMRALAANQNLRRLDIIDIAPSVVDRFVNVTGVKNVTYSRDVESFLHCVEYPIVTQRDFVIPASGNEITENDIDKGYLRITVDFKRYFPKESCDVTVLVGGQRSQRRFTNRDGGDKRRSHLLKLGGDLIAELGIKPGGKVKVTVLGKTTFKLETL